MAKANKKNTAKVVKKNAKTNVKPHGAVHKTVTYPHKLATKHVSGFADFLRERGVVGLAIGVVFGTQAKQIIDQLVSAFLSPFLGLILPGKGPLNQKFFTFTMNEKTATFGWGALVFTMISFLLLAIVIYLSFRIFRLDKLEKPKED